MLQRIGRRRERPIRPCRNLHYHCRSRGRKHRAQTRQLEPNSLGGIRLAEAIARDRVQRRPHRELSRRVSGGSPAVHERAFAGQLLRRQDRGELPRNAGEVTRAGVAQTQVARELGIHPNLLRNWVRQFDSGRWEANAGAELKSANTQELEQLRRELNRVKMGRPRGPSVPPKVGRSSMPFKMKLLGGTITCRGGH
jgi:hypothetical protein